MPPRKDGASYRAVMERSAYRPTSLDFINLPNPIEPDGSGSQKHPLNGTPSLQNTSSYSGAELFKHILDGTIERPAKRRLLHEVTENNNLLLDLPKLPVRQQAKRLRIPPTLSGLHQPPPDAGLLPSINVEQPQVLPPRYSVPDNRLADINLEKSTDHAELPPRPENIPSSSSSLKESPNNDRSRPKVARAKRNKWTDEETAQLLKGVSRFGIGNWTKIVNCTDFNFRHRTALDLKDRFRVCCPDQYNGEKQSVLPNESPTGREEATKAKSGTKGPQSERISSSKLKELGIDAPFTKTGRRSRHGYSPAEDEALLKGFRRYGKQWAQIVQDSSLGLSARKPTDLRDRLRTRYPEEYASAGLAPKLEKKLSAVPRRMQQHSAETNAGLENEPGAEGLNSEQYSATASTAVQTASNTNDANNPPATSGRKVHQPSLFALDDVFFGADLGAHDDESEHIVLDRGILDWVPDVVRNPAADSGKSSGIDPLMTLKLPKPVSSMPAPVPTSAPANNATSLPSLSTLLPDTVNPNQLELPSLTQWYGAGHDGKSTGITIPSLDELLMNVADAT